MDGGGYPASTVPVESGGVWQPRHARRKRNPVRYTVLGVVAVVVLLVLVAAVFVKGNYAAYRVASSSGAPTLQPGDQIVVKKGNSGIHRGDLILFADSELPATSVKRVVGVGGDKISEISGRLVVNGIPAKEPYLAPGTLTTDVADLTVPPGQVYVLGDNRGDSKDSRSIGPVPLSGVKGRIVLRIRSGRTHVL